ncbi:MAG: hypothetical protein AAB368_00745, partial [bacterium]
MASIQGSWRCVAVGRAAAAWAPAAPAADWPQFQGGPARTGIAGAGHLAAAPAWEADLGGAVYASPV